VAQPKTEDESDIDAVIPLKQSEVAPTDGECEPEHHTESARTASYDSNEALSQDSEDDLDGELQLGDYKEDVVEIITCLMKLSMVMRKPVHHDHMSMPRDAVISYFEERDLEHVRHKFPKANAVLAERLGKAISQRRHYIKYRESHADKMAQGMEWDGDGKTVAKPASTIASSLAKPGLDLDEAASESSMSSYQSSGLNESKLRPPPLPEAGRQGMPFECPLCRILVNVPTGHAWKYVPAPTMLMYKELTNELSGSTCTWIYFPMSARSWTVLFHTRPLIAAELGRDTKLNSTGGPGRAYVDARLSSRLRCSWRST
jgi:hypothetical protein